MVALSEKGRAASAQALVRSVARDIVATVLEAEFQSMKDDLERSRSEVARVTREHERAREKLERERSTSAVRTAKRDQAVTVAREVSEYAAEATQKVYELSRATTAQVTQAKAPIRPCKVGRKTHR